MQKDFAYNIIPLLQNDPNIIGLAAGGSWIHNKLDEYSDLDLVLVTKKKISGNKDTMLAYAKSFGDLISVLLLSAAATKAAGFYYYAYDPV